MAASADKINSIFLLDELMPVLSFLVEASAVAVCSRPEAFAQHKLPSVLDISASSLLSYCAADRLQPFITGVVQTLGVPHNYCYLATLLSTNQIETSVRDIQRALQPPLPIDLDERASTVDPERGTSDGNPFAGLSTEEITQGLFDELQEQQNARNAIRKFVETLGRQGVWQALCETRTLLQNGGEYTANGLQRTAGGIFLRICKQKKSHQQQRIVLERSVGLPPLRDYQKRVVDSLLGHGENALIVAPTGTGKTIIFVEYIRRFLQTTQTGKAAVIVPHVALCHQHQAQFDLAGFHHLGWRVGSFHGDKPLVPAQWRQQLECHSVIIMTAQLFLNMLRAPNAATMADLHVLVLDEAHHSKLDDPYNHIMHTYHSQGRPPHLRVLGFTASPVSAINEVTTQKEFTRLMDNLNARKFFHVPDSDPEVHSVAPPPMEREMYLDPRRLDQDFQQLLWQLSCAEARKLERRVTRLFEAAPLEDQPDPSASVLPLSDSFTPMFTMELLTSVKKWLDAALKCAHQQTKWALMASAQLVKVLLKGVEIAPEVGREATLSHIGRKLHVLLTKCRPSFQEVRRPSKRVHRSAQASLNAAPPAVAPVGPAASPGPAAADASPGVSRQSIQDYLAAEAARDAAAAGGYVLAGQTDGTLNNGSDVTTSVPLEITGKGNVDPEWKLFDEMVIRLFAGEGSLEGVVPISAAYPHGTLQQEGTFPKFWELVDYLMEYQDRQEFHGIVFVGTRHAAYLIAEWVERCAQLSFVDEVLVFTGHASGSTAKKMKLPGMQDDAAMFVRGMTACQQQDVLTRFRVPGRRLLVSTSAAEEGVDVPSCEFVLRFTAAVTGIQRVQSRGRSRMLRSEYVCLIHRGTLEETLHRKAMQEEENMRTVLNGPATASYRQF